MARNRIATLIILLVFLALVSCSPVTKDNVAFATSSYEDLVGLFEEWREFQKPEMTDGVPDYTAAAMSEQRRGLETFQNRLAAIDTSAWSVSEQIDYHLVRAEMNGLEFDHRVLRPWSRNPCFYVAFYPGPTDVPNREGPDRHGVLRLWKYEFPLSDEKLAEFRMKIQAIPKLLEQAKGNLTEDAKDLWFLGIRIKKQESGILTDLAGRLGEHHPDLVPELNKAKAAVDDFRAWMDDKHSAMQYTSSGIGVENYDWLMKNVYLLPYTWEQQLAVLQRELDRSLASLKLEEQRNRRLAKLELPANGEEYHRRFNQAVDAFMHFLQQNEVMTVRDYMGDALRARERGFIPPDRPRGFFTQVEYRDSFPMRCHGTHWFDLARMEREPHASPIRRVPLLYDIWAHRAEGLATGMEEMMMHAGYLDERPRSRELVYILLANRAARAMGDLKMHSQEFTLEDAVEFGSSWTPYNWMPRDGSTVWTDEQLYLNQPGYGMSYVIGKLQIERLIADRSHQLGDEFTLKRFFDEFHASGMIPTSLIRWETTGLTDEIRTLW